MRLVVDTGLHQLRWTRAQAIAYMATHSGSPMSEVVAEIERYMAWPGQALGYTAVGRRADPSILPDNFRDREAPSDRLALDAIAFAGRFQG